MAGSIIVLFVLCLLCLDLVKCQRDAGILYEVWHTPPSNLMREVSQKNGTLLTTETVIRSNGEWVLDDVYLKYDLDGDIWNVQPQVSPDFGILPMY